jgi:hypothetical protein
MMLKIIFTLVIGSCLRSSGVAVQCGVLLQPIVKILLGDIVRFRETC